MRTEQPLVEVQRWTRYGHDRAYVRVNDLQVGYRDLATGEVVCDHREHVELVARATARASRPAAYVPRHARPD